MMAGRAWWPEQEAAGHIASAVRVRGRMLLLLLSSASLVNSVQVP